MVNIDNPFNQSNTSLIGMMENQLQTGSTFNSKFILLPDYEFATTMVCKMIGKKTILPLVSKIK